MDIVEAIAAKNKCYQVGAPLTPQGIMLHSIGVPQPNAAVMARSYNQYQPGGRSVCVHGFIQRDGTYYQTLPYTMRAWHCGGAANATHIGIEMTEPASIVYTGGASWRDLDPAATEAHVRGTPQPWSFSRSCARSTRWTRWRTALSSATPRARQEASPARTQIPHTYGGRLG